MAAFVKPSPSYGCEYYPNTLLDTLYTLRNSQQFCDAEISTGGSVVKAHRVILSAGSPYFQAMFTSRLAEETQSSIEMKSIKPNILTQIIRFMYTGNIEVTAENAQELVVAADMLQMNYVLSVFTNFLKNELYVSNALGIYRFAKAYSHGSGSSLEYLKVVTMGFIFPQFIKLVMEKEFLETPKEIILDLLEEMKRKSPFLPLTLEELQHISKTRRVPRIGYTSSYLFVTPTLTLYCNQQWKIMDQQLKQEHYGSQPFGEEDKKKLQLLDAVLKEEEEKKKRLLDEKEEEEKKKRLLDAELAKLKAEFAELAELKAKLKGEKKLLDAVLKEEEKKKRLRDYQLAKLKAEFAELTELKAKLKGEKRLLDTELAELAEMKAKLKGEFAELTKLKAKLLVLDAEFKEKEEKLPDTELEEEKRRSYVIEFKELPDDELKEKEEKKLLDAELKEKEEKEKTIYNYFPFPSDNSSDNLDFEISKYLLSFLLRVLKNYEWVIIVDARSHKNSLGNIDDTEDE
ncbi:kelch-like protein 40b [Homarus americanus]|uniref:kelch-like protein 40b n=1 Tax=Homarus americanus TaxID=6706 RepID=UPI001C43D495|nr:kelch-like protein 40b [Homarus americanus]